MNKYQELKQQQETELNDFPIFFAFSNQQLKEGMEKFNLTMENTDKIYSIGCGGYILKTDSKKLSAMFNRQSTAMDKAIKADKTGENFIFDMFDYELSNHEYCITYDTEPTLDALGINQKDIDNNEALKTGLRLAKNSQPDY